MRSNTLERRAKKYAARQYVSETHDHKPDVHDRIAQDLPINSIVAIDIVSDPYSDIGEKIKVLRSIRDDQLACLKSHGRINQAEFEAGRKWERLHELSTIGPINAIDPTKEAVDGGKIVDSLTDHQIDAFRQLANAYNKLGAFGGSLLFDVLGSGLTLPEVAKARGFVSAREVNYVGRRFIECLETLAVLWGFADRPCT